MSNPGPMIALRCVFAFLCCGLQLGGTAAEPAAAAVSQGTNSVLSAQAMQLLRANCFSCHNPEKKKGGLILTGRATLLEGGDDGAVVDLNQPAQSKLLAVLSPDSDPHMPPKKQLNPGQIELVEKWLRAGAPWNDLALAAMSAARPVVLGDLPAGYTPVLATVLSPDATKLAAAFGNRLCVYKFEQGKFVLLTDIVAHRDVIRSLAWSPDGRLLASGAFREIILWDTTRFRCGAILASNLTERISALRFTPDSRTLAAADGATSESGWVRLFDVTSGQAKASWQAHADTIFDLSISANGALLATAGGDKLIKIWDIASHRQTGQLEGHSGAVMALAFNPDGSQLVSAGADKQLKVWAVSEKETIISLGTHAHSLGAVWWSADGKTILCADETGAIRSYTDFKAHTGEQSSAAGTERTIADTKDVVYALAANRDATLIAAGVYDGTVQVFDAARKKIATLAAPAAVAESNRVVSLSVFPQQAVFAPNQTSRRVLVSGRCANGEELDLTSRAVFLSSNPGAAAAENNGELRALSAGSGRVEILFGALRAEIPFKVAENSAMAPVSFLRDVLPLLSKAGCNSGSCHAKADGQNGFKLSVFSYDPASDYFKIVKDERGRRVFPAAPEESLFIKKPTMAVEHGGGQRFEPGSETYQTLVRWIRTGMKYRLPDEPTLVSIGVYPKERRYSRGAEQPLAVTASYSDGSQRDVTALSDFTSSDKEIARVTEDGMIHAGTVSGEAVVVARYVGFVDATRVTIPSERLLPADKYASLPVRNYIDQLAYAQFQKLGLFPSALCSDAEFVRRSSLDATGTLPSLEETRAFLADPQPGKRERWIAHVLARPAYADYWANRWADLLRPNPDRVGIKSVYTLDQWLRESFRENKPYDQFAREIVLAEGNNHRDGPVVIYRDRREPPELTTLFSQVFLGVRLECARCHHHPNEKWSQNDFYEFAAYFGPLKQRGAGLSPPISAGKELFYFAPGGDVKNPVTGDVMRPKPPDGPLSEVGASSDPRLALAHWMTAPENPFFAKAAANRIWAVFFGKGIVDPVDDFRISNPASNEPLLNALAEDLVRHHFDLKNLMRTIMESHLYQLSSEPNEFNVADTRNFSRSYRRRLPAEVLDDAVSDVTGVREPLHGLPPGSRAVQAWTYKIESHFLDAFGRPNPSSDCPCDRDMRTSVVQSLHLMNSRELQAKLGDPKGRLKQLVDSSKATGEIVTELYLATLCRYPDASEQTIAAAAFTAPKATRQTAAEDVLWALLNSAEFVFNH